MRGLAFNSLEVPERLFAYTLLVAGAQPPKRAWLRVNVDELSGPMLDPNALHPASRTDSNSFVTLLEPASKERSQLTGCTSQAMLHQKDCDSAVSAVSAVQAERTSSGETQHTFPEK